MKTLKRHRG